MTPWIAIPLVILVYGIFFPYLCRNSDPKHPERLEKLRKEWNPHNVSFD